MQNRFQWVGLQIKQILKCKSEEAVKSRLGKLPSGLKAAYDEIYSEIKDLDEHDKVLADSAFMWVMCACKPLNSDELISAIRVDSNQDALHLASKITESSLLSLCKNLLVIDSQLKVWRFSHLSVTEYFENNHWDLRQANCHVAKVCLGLLIETYKNTDPDAVSSRLGDEPDQKTETHDMLDLAHPLQLYARHHWMIHVQMQEGQEVGFMLAHLLKTFFGSPGESSLQYRRWYRQIVIDSWRRPSTSAFTGIHISDIAPERRAVFVMCRFSFYTVLLDWWKDTEIEISLTNSRGNNLLTLAAMAGCKQICKNLIDRGIQVNMPLQRGNYGSVLAAAAYRGRAETIKFLVQEAGADVNMLLQSGRYGSALAAAVYMGQTETVKFLVQEVGADVDMLLQSGRYGSALAAAAYWGETEIVKFLVQKAGADVNMLLQSGDYGSALAAAAYGGETEIVKFLVQEVGADVDMLLQSGDYGSALAAAVYGRETEIVMFLVQDAGADVNMLLQGGSYGSALAAAAFKRETETVKFLVQEVGADVDMLLQSGRYGSALAAAAYGGQTEIVKFLVQDAGADVNMLLQSGDYGSALAAAAYKRETEIVKFLVQEVGADVDMLLQSGDYGSALAAAAYGGETEIVKFLVQDAGADVNMLLQSGRYDSALAAAVYGRETETVKFLVQDAGANVNQQLRFGKYGSVLAAAAYWGWKECAEALMEARAEVNLRLENGLFSSALQASRTDITKEDLLWVDWDSINEEESQRRDKTEVVELLLRHGATSR